MSKRNKRSRSAFEDPAGLDPAYRIGRVASDLWSQAFEAKGSNLLQAPHQRKKLAISLSNRHRRLQRNQAPARNQQAQMPPRRRFGRRFAKRRRVGSRSRSRFGRRRYGGRRTKRTRSNGRVKRSFSRRRGFGRKSQGVFARHFRNVLTQPVELSGEAFFALNNFGDNLQGKCSWAAVAPGWTPQLYDWHLQAQENAAVADINRTVNICMAKSLFNLQFKNMSNSRCDVTLYKLYPKRDIPVSTLDVLGIIQGGVNTSVVETGARTAHLATFPGAPGTWRLPAWDEHDYDIFQNTTVPEMFRVKKVMRKFLEPGQFVIVKNNDKKEKIRSYGDFGLLSGVGQTLAANFRYLKEFGPIWLFRVQGSNQHNSTLAVANKTDGAVGSTMGCYNVEFFYRSKTTSYGAVGTQPQKQIAMTTNRLNQFAVANEIGFEMRQAQNAAMDIQ